MENFKPPVPVEWQNRRVLTTAQLAEYYGCSVDNIRDNFRKNKDKFIEGKHFVKLEGEDIKIFRDHTENFRPVEGDYTENFRPVVPARTSVMYLWTERGAARHAKMLSTDKAWEVFEALEDTYFDYVINTVPVPAKRSSKSVKKIRRPLSLTACVYILLMSNDTVKIGHSDNVNSRISNIKSKYKLTIKNSHHTYPLSREIARLIEKACHEIFSSSKVDGEFFNVDFETACKIVDALVKFANALPLLSNFERGEKLLTIADTMRSLPENQMLERNLFIEAAGLFVGRKFE